MLLDPGPPSEEELAGSCPGRLAVEKLKETVSRLPKRRQHLPGHPRWGYALAQQWSGCSFTFVTDRHLLSPCKSVGTVSFVRRCLWTVGCLVPTSSAYRWGWHRNWWAWRGMASPCITQRNTGGATWYRVAEITWCLRRTTPDLCAHTGSYYTEHTLQKQDYWV